MKKEISIKCKTKTNTISTFLIKIYNHNNLIYQSNITANEYFTIKLKYDHSYLIILTANGNLVPKRYVCELFITSYGYNCFCFNFDTYDRPQYLNMILTDKNYIGLPIEKGDLFLWHKLTTYQ